VKVVVGWVLGLLVVVGAGVVIETGVGEKVAVPVTASTHLQIIGVLIPHEGSISDTLPDGGYDPVIPSPENLVRFYRSPSARIRHLLSNCAENGCSTLPNATATARLGRYGTFGTYLPAGAYVMLANSCGITERVTIPAGGDVFAGVGCEQIKEVEGYG
jgi:hypothetical protein